MKCLWDRFFSEQFHPPPPLKHYSTLRPHLHVAGSLTKGNALSDREPLDIQVLSLSLRRVKKALHVRKVRCSQLTTGHYKHVIHVLAEPRDLLSRTLCVPAEIHYPSARTSRWETALLEHVRYLSHKITHYEQNAVHPDCNRKLTHRNTIFWTPVRNVVTTLTELSRVDRMISELWIGKDVERTIRGLICGTIAKCLQRLRSRTPVAGRRCGNSNEWYRVDRNVRLIRTDRPRVHVPFLRQTQVHRHALLRPGM